MIHRDGTSLSTLSWEGAATWERAFRRHALQSPDLFELRATQLVDSQSAEGAVQPEQFLGVLVEPLANQEAREAWCQEEQGAEESLVGHKDSKVEN